MSYSREEVKAITDKILNMAKADAVEVEFRAVSARRRGTPTPRSPRTWSSTISRSTITVYYGQKSASTIDPPVRRRVAEGGDRAGAERWRSASRTTPRLMPLVKPPQDYMTVEAAMPSAVNFGPAERARDGEEERRHLREEGRARRRLHPEDALDARRRPTPKGCSPTTATPRRASSSPAARPTAPAPGGPGTTSVKDVTQIDAAAITEIAADKALKSQKPRAIEPGNYTVILEPRPAARFLSLLLGALNARAGRRGPQLHERRGAGHDEGRPEGVRRQRHASAARSTTRSCGRRRSAPTASPRRRHLGREGRRQEPVLRPLLGEEDRARPRRATPPGQSIVMDGGTDDDRADDQDDEARPARDVLLVHRVRSSR